MASRPRRRSKDEPPNLSELKDTFNKLAASFIEQFNSSEHRMRWTAGRFHKIAAEVRQTQQKIDAVRRTAAVTGGVGLGLRLMIVAAPFTVQASMLAAAGAAVAAGTAVVSTNIIKIMKEKGMAKEVETVGEYFLETVELFKNELEEIKTMCERLEEESAKVQAENTKIQFEEFQRILRRVSELKRGSEGALTLAGTVMNRIRELVMLIMKVFSITGTTEKDIMLRASIIQSADQCQNVVDQFDQMKKELASLQDSKEAAV